MASIENLFFACMKKEKVFTFHKFFPSFFLLKFIQTENNKKQ